MPRKRKIRADGRYEVTFYRNGKRIHFYGATQREANHKKEEYIAMLEACPLYNHKAALGEWCEAWLESIRNDVAPSTHQSYTEVLTRFIVAAPIGTVLLSDLTPQMFRVYWQSLLDQGKSTRTVIYCHTVCSMALKQAVFDGAIASNPLLAVKRPKLIKKKIAAMTKEQLHQLIAAADDPLYRNIIILGARTGMRREEILGLTWKGVNFEAGTVSITQTVIRIQGRVTIADSTKTKSSCRTISVDREVLSILRAQHAKYLRQKLANPSFHDLGLIFFRDSGEPVHPDTCTRWFRRYADACGLTGFTFHSLRHTHATLLLEAGVNFKTVQSRLGHSSFSTTMDVYAHVTPAMESEVIQAIEKSIGK